MINIKSIVIKFFSCFSIYVFINIAIFYVIMIQIIITSMLYFHKNIHHQKNITFCFYLSSFSTQFYRPFLSFVLSQGPMKSRYSIGSSVHPTSSLDRRAPIIRKWRGRGKEILLAVISLSRGKWRLLLHLFLSHYSLPVSERELINAQMQQGALFCNNSVYMYIYISLFSY